MQNGGGGVKIFRKKACWGGSGNFDFRGVSCVMEEGQRILGGNENKCIITVQKTIVLICFKGVNMHEGVN